MNSSKKNHKATKIETGKYNYRGYTCQVNEDVNTGYWGRWSFAKGENRKIVSAYPRKNGGTTSSLKRCKREIDLIIDN